MKRSQVRKASLLCAVFLSVLVVSAQSSFATMLTPSSAIIAPGEADPGVGAVVVGGGLPIPFLAASYSGTLTSTVWTNDPANPFGLDKLTFTYVIANDAGSAHELHRFTISSFDNFQTDVSYSTTLPAGIAPLFIDRSPGLGDVVGFSYPTPIPPVLLGPGAITPGSTSMVMVIQTDALLFQPTMASVINGSTTMVPSLAPQALIPEPSSLALAALGAAWGLGAIVHRRRKVA
jgi:hypothetical protein